jgi:hypothetical protein
MDDRDDWVPEWGRIFEQRIDPTVSRSHDRTIKVGLEFHMRLRPDDLSEPPEEPTPN